MNGSSIFLDTNIIVPFLNGDALITQKIENLGAINLPVIVVGELYFGAMKSARPEKNSTLIQQLTQRCIIYSINEKTTTIYGELKATLAKQGTPIPENDVWIAALSKTYNFSLVTRDKHFTKVPQLNIIEW